MKFSIFTLLLISLFAFTSCNKNNDFNKNDKKEYKEDDKKDCFQLVYPLTYTLPDGSEISGEGEETLWTAIKAWYEDHPDVDAKPVLQYPVEIIFEHIDAPQTINNEDEMIEAKKDCDDKDWEKELCFEFVYPLTYTMPDGSEISGEEETLWTAIKAWYEDHPDVEAKPVLQYPVEIILEHIDAPQTINNEDEMIAAKEDCDD